jgi:hypothetical protein
VAGAFRNTFSFSENNFGTSIGTLDTMYGIAAHIYAAEE